MGAYRIVFAGPIGAGKTTAIQALSDIPPISTEVASAEAEAVGKATTTVAFDLGQVVLENGDLVQLYGAPGQARFDFMWPMISENAIGAVILADNRRPDTVELTLQYVREFAPRIAAGNCVVGVGRSKLRHKPGVDEYQDVLEAAGFAIPVMEVDVRRKEDTLLLLDVLLARLEAAHSGA
ncbi:MAG TPA: ATP/GTP-binding protein [Burkholderiaceae bacterium]|nr:ATP/GTP-binding protein [Burkholderiaceae bacterium]